MATVIDFSVRTNDRKSESVKFGPAQIVIFPGVRFERLTEEIAPTNYTGNRKQQIISRSNQAIAENLD